MKNVKMTVVDITPEKAMQMLQINTRNVPMKKNIVLFYAQQMLDNKWQFNGEPIIISEGNVLLDGQHRLAAIVKSQTTQKCVIVEGIHPDAFLTIDTGKSRTTGDTLALQGVENYSRIAAGIGGYLRLKSGWSAASKSTPRSKAPAKRDTYELYVKHADMFQSLQASISKYYRAMRLLNTSEMMKFAIWLRLECKHSEETICKFFAEVSGYSQNIENSVTLALRDMFIKNLSATLKMTPKHRHALIVKAWNAYITGKELKRLTYSVEEVTPTFI